MCGCVPGEVVRPCSAANPSDFCVLSVRSLRRSSTYAYRRARDYDVHSYNNYYSYSRAALSWAETIHKYIVTQRSPIVQRPKKHFKNEQRSKDAAAKKRPNTSGVGKINNYYEDIYIPPYNNTD